MSCRRYPRFYQLISNSNVPKSWKRNQNWIRKQVTIMIDNEYYSDDEEYLMQERISKIKHIMRSKKIKAHWTRSIKIQNTQNVLVKNDANEFANTKYTNV